MTARLPLNLPPLPGKPRVKRMHYYDAGETPDGSPGAAFRCARCGHDDGWTFGLTIREIRQGLPCPSCNEVTA